MVYQRFIEFAALSDTGLVREHNEDAIVVCSDYGCVILADGMGGYNAGEVASAMTAQIVADFLCNKLDGIWFPVWGLRPAHFAHWVIDAIALANRQVMLAAQNNAACVGMGTTIALACCLHDKLIVAHVGDSRVYRYRSGVLERMTQDHSVLQEQINAGHISEADARFSNIRNLITRAVGTQATVDVDVSIHPMRESDLYMICSDGLTDMLSHDEIQSILRLQATNLSECCQSLIDSANRNGGMDNSSVVLFKAETLQGSSLLQKIFFR
ncbi:Stp1/IreP family PP2C-type Ser/Thr phosphatase [Undibacterium sp. SXout7W]|uniref:Stp1/IreP family PP2C-type Ser/Thr phosphatase n=1 Tax=Undibacterium sp. SXout7W TaxID=3413049 RepID=UPI003BF45765